MTIMKNAFSFMKKELASVSLVLLSYIPMFFIGSILDILLTHFYAQVENGKRGLPLLSIWIYDAMAGRRFLAQEIMLCLWILMVLCFIFNAFISDDQNRFRIRFAYSFFFTWLLAIAIASFIAFACAAPFDLLLAHVGDAGVFATVVHSILVFELVLVLVSPIGLIIRRKLKRNKT
jgi:hypothetical protein